MGSQLYRSALFAIVLATILIDGTLAKNVKHPPALTQVMEVGSDITILAPIMCIDENPYPDLNDTTGTWYYQCFWVEEQQIWGAFHTQCPDKAYFDKEYLTCLEAPTTPAPFVCVSDGIFVHEDCTKYYKCITIAGTIRKYETTCPANSHFNPANSLCAIGPCPTP